jgi:hypothetical protein
MVTLVQSAQLIRWKVIFSGLPEDRWHFSPLSCIKESAIRLTRSRAALSPRYVFNRVKLRDYVLARESRTKPVRNAGESFRGCLTDFVLAHSRDEVQLVEIV